MALSVKQKKKKKNIFDKGAFYCAECFVQAGKSSAKCLTSGGTKFRPMKRLIKVPGAARCRGTSSSSSSLRVFVFIFQTP